MGVDRKRVVMASPRTLLSNRWASWGVTALAAVAVGLVVGTSCRRTDTTPAAGEDPVEESTEPVASAPTGEWYRTTPYSEDFLSTHPYAKDKGARSFRIVITGGSTAQGSPYVTGFYATPEEGGIASWLKANLSARFPEADVEVVNAAIGGAETWTIRDVGREVLELQPDVLIVASCNNEGCIAPDQVEKELVDRGGSKVLQEMLSRGPDQPLVSSQHPHAEQGRKHYEENLTLILEAAREKKVPVLLCTLPVRLRYWGMETGHLIDGGEEPDEVPERCHEACARFSVEDWQHAQQSAEACGAELDKRSPFPWRSFAALSMAEQGNLDDRAAEWLARDQGACIADGVRLHFGGQHERAIETLSGCDRVPEALYWIGLSYEALGRLEEAKWALRQTAEWIPRNRCRPSYNELIRSLAARYDHVHLADLERRAPEHCKNGIPGVELFIDYCHMNWRGYQTMADEIMTALDERGLRPPGPEATEGLPSEAQLLELFELPR
jgi:hypothetical protein